MGYGVPNEMCFQGFRGGRLERDQFRMRLGRGRLEWERPRGLQGRGSLERDRYRRRLGRGRLEREGPRMLQGRGFLERDRHRRRLRRGRLEREGHRRFQGRGTFERDQAQRFKSEDVSSGSGLGCPWGEDAPSGAEFAVGLPWGCCGDPGV